MSLNFKGSLLDCVNRLPPEIAAQIIVEMFHTYNICLFNMFCPEWLICYDGTSAIREHFKFLRTDVYTRGAEGQRGTFVTKFCHGKDDHLYLPISSYDYLNSPITERDIADMFPLAYQMAMETLDRHILHYFRQFSRADGMTGSPKEVAFLKDGIPVLTDPTAVTRIPFKRWFFPKYNRNFKNETWSKDQPSYKGRRHLMFNVPLSTWTRASGQMLPNLSGTEEEQRSVKRAYLQRLAMEHIDQLNVDWMRMSHLETVFLDLRSMYIGRIPEQEVLDAARSMRVLNLRLLVIAGLRSFHRWPVAIGKVFDLPAEEKQINIEVLEDKAKFKRRKHNWVSKFRHALRPGGQLILIDFKHKLIVKPQMEMVLRRKGLLRDGVAVLEDDDYVDSVRHLFETET